MANQKSKEETMTNGWPTLLFLLVLVSGCLSPSVVYQPVEKICRQIPWGTGRPDLECRQLEKGQWCENRGGAAYVCHYEMPASENISTDKTTILRLP